jgi:hypothetical protein
MRAPERMACAHGGSERTAAARQAFRQDAPVLVSVCLTGPSAFLPDLEVRVRAALGKIPGVDVVHSDRPERTAAGTAVSCCRLDVRCSHAQAPVYRSAQTAVATSGVGGGSVGAVRLIGLDDYLRTA